MYTSLCITARCYILLYVYHCMYITVCILQNSSSDMSVDTVVSGMDSKPYSDSLSPGEQGMYSYLTAEQLTYLVDCLMQSHEFALKFNTDHEQRNVLWKAGKWVLGRRLDI